MLLYLAIPGFIELVVPQTEGTIDSERSKRYYINQSLLCSVSLEWQNHVQTAMKEGKEGRIILREVEQLTVARFVEWLYSTDYTLGAKTL